MQLVNKHNLELQLFGWVENYLRNVIGVHYILEDGYPAITINNQDKPPTIFLPVTRQSLDQFFGHEFTDNASPELIFSVLVGLAYHEVAHVLSGEDHTFKPHVIQNLINDANDFTFVPQKWPGSIPFTLMLVETVYSAPLSTMANNNVTVADIVKRLLLASIEYLRKLRICFDDKWVRHYPTEHQMHSYFEQLIPILRQARQAPVKCRTELMQQYYDTLKKVFFDYATDVEKVKSSNIESLFDQAMLQAGHSISNNILPMRRKSCGKMLQHLESVMDNMGVRDNVQKTIVQMTENREKKKGRNHHSHSNSLATITKVRTCGECIEPNQKLASAIRVSLQPKLFQRSFARRSPQCIGRKFTPSQFYQVKTQPRNPRLRSDITRIAKTMDETALALLCDRSGSMEENEKFKIAQRMMATLYDALVFLPKVQVALYGFDTTIVEIASWKNSRLAKVYGQISVGLRPQGGTDLPKALKKIIETIKDVRAKRRIIIVLTDGDLKGSKSIQSSARLADEENVEVVVVGIKGSSQVLLKKVFGENGLYVESLHDLPQKLANVVVGQV